MSIATEILNLRSDRTSSVSMLLNAIDWARGTKSTGLKMMRGHAIKTAADLVLLNVAAHAQETLHQNETPVRPGNRRAAAASRRRRRLSDPNALLRQHRLFA
jgi:hypothetical protein